MEKRCDVHGLVRFMLGGQKWYCPQCRSSAVLRAKRKQKKRALEFLGGHCIRCGYNKCPDALEFHHTEPEHKDLAIGSTNRAWDVIERELKKCILLCANCHREEHYRMRKENELESVTKMLSDL